MSLFFEDRLLDSVRTQASGGRSQGVNFWNPTRVALCTCGWVGKGTLAEVNRLAEQHAAPGAACEGCDHAIYIESAVLDSKEAHT